MGECIVHSLTRSQQTLECLWKIVSMFPAGQRGEEGWLSVLVRVQLLALMPSLPPALKSLASPLISAKTMGLN